jgi:hypothetical protein
VRLRLADTDTQESAEEQASETADGMPAGAVFDVVSDESPLRGLSAVPDNTSAVAEFLDWFERTAVDADICSRWTLQVPPAFRADVAAEARRRGEAWLEFADSLTTRADTSA